MNIEAEIVRKAAEQIYNFCCNTFCPDCPFNYEIMDEKRRYISSCALNVPVDWELSKAFRKSIWKGDINE